MLYPASRDIYRYLWDGWQSLLGINPYGVVPGNGGFLGLDPHFNFVPTPYPPIAQALFVIPAGLYQTFGLGWARLVLAIPVFLIGLLLWRRMSNRWWMAYWLNPLVWVHLVMDVHIDSWAAVLALVAAVALFGNKIVKAAVFLALAFLVKPYVLVWLPLFVKKGGWIVMAVFLAVILSAYLPYRYSLSRYGEFVELMRQWQPGWVEPQMGILLAGVGVGLLLLRKVSWTILTVAGMVGLVASPVVYPWYGLWLWPIALLSGKRWVVIAVAVGLLIISPRA